MNFRKLKKDEMIWLYENFCRHGHRYIEHMCCLEVEIPKSPILYEKIGFLDIETTGLNANFDYIISYALLVEGEMRGRVLTKEEATDYNILDKKLMKEFVKDAKDLDRIVVYWGCNRRHDLPFLRTRVLKWKLKFPIYREVFVTDCYDLVKGKLRLHRNRLENVCDFFGIPSKQHRLDSQIWQRAKLGHGESLRWVWLHNKEDVYSLKAVYDLLNEFGAGRKTSI